MLLRKLKHSDREEVIRLAYHPEVMRTLPDSFRTLHLGVDYLVTGERKYDFAIEENEEFAGCLGVWPGVDEKRVRAEIGIWLGRPYWNKGLGTQAIADGVKWAFDNLPQVKCIYATPFSSNPASCRMLEKNFFSLVGVLHSSLIKDGIVLDELIYERTR